ncbi:MAG: hypothetical protein ACYS30_20475 [Planctomycetota bacterium]|jgi:hypothetical protein
MPNGHGFSASDNTSKSNVSDLEKLLGLFGKGGGIFGLSNPLSAGLLVGGSELLKGLGGLIGGKSDEEKRREEVFNLARNRLSQAPTDPEQYVAQFKQAQAPQQRRRAATIEKRLGLDVGTAQGELAASQNEVLANFLLNAKMRADELKSQKENFLLSLMGQLGRA